MKKILTVAALVGFGVLLGGCASTPEHLPKPEPGEIVTLYDTSNDYNNVSGTALSDNEINNVRQEGKVEKYYNGRYIDPNTGDMYSKGTIYRVTESPHWNTTPNHDPQPYEIDEAYKHVKNLANATPLYAELDQKNHVTADLNKTLSAQVEVMFKTTEQMKAQAEQLKEAHRSTALLMKENQKLKMQKNNLYQKESSTKTSSKVFGQDGEDSPKAAMKELKSQRTAFKENQNHESDTGVSNLNF